MTPTSYLETLKNAIDITRVPFSDRGSRILVFRLVDEDCLFIKLAERRTDIQPDIEAYLHRPPFIRDLCLVDHEGEPIGFEVTTYPHIIYLHTELGDFRVVFRDERVLAFGLPPNVTAGLKFHVSPQFWEQAAQGGVFKAVRNLAYASNREAVHNAITMDEGGYVVEFIVDGEHADDGTIELVIGSDIQYPFQAQPIGPSCEAAESRWQDWFSRVPPVLPRYQQTYAYAWWIMANNLISPQGRVAYEAMTPSKMNYVGLWLWDSAMHSLAYRHIDPGLARDQIRAMLDCQLPDGMLPDAVYDEGVISTLDHPIYAEVTKPPIVAWAALKLHETDPDLDFLREIYVPLVRWNAWWFSMNDDNVNGLAQYNHPYSSGLDNSPLWDNNMPVESPDLNTYLCVQMGSLALMAEQLGMEAEGAMWRRRAASIVRRMIESFWDEERGLFQALHEGQPVQVVTPFNLYPLWAGQLPEHINERLIAHLTNPDEFWNEYIIPTVARNDANYNPEDMWRGPVWANINYFFVEALRQIGRDDLANEIQTKTLDLVASHPSIYEYYDAETGEPAKTAADIFGWTAAVFIDLAIQASQEEGDIDAQQAGGEEAS